MSSEVVEKVKEKLNGKVKLIVMIGLVGIALIFISDIFVSSGTDPSQKASVPSEFSLEEYIAGTEGRLARIVSSITGEKDPQIMVTAETTVKKIYAVENKISEKNGGADHESEETYVFAKGSGGTQDALMLTEEQPVIKGVVVVSLYGDNYVVKEKIIDAVKTSMGLSAGKVCVVPKYSG